MPTLTVSVYNRVVVPPSIEEKIFSQLLALASRVTELVTKVERLQAHVEAQSTRIANANDKVIRFAERVDNHAEKLAKLELTDTAQEKLRHRLSGLWLGVGLVISALASATALAASFLR